MDLRCFLLVEKVFAFFVQDAKARSNTIRVFQALADRGCVSPHLPSKAWLRSAAARTWNRRSPPSLYTYVQSSPITL